MKIFFRLVLVADQLEKAVNTEVCLFTFIPTSDTTCFRQHKAQNKLDKAQPNRFNRNIYNVNVYEINKAIGQDLLWHMQITKQIQAQII